MNTRTIRKVAQNLNTRQNLPQNPKIHLLGCKFKPNHTKDLNCIGTNILLQVGGTWMLAPEECL